MRVCTMGAGSGVGLVYSPFTSRAQSRPQFSSRIPKDNVHIRLARAIAPATLSSHQNRSRRNLNGGRTVAHAGHDHSHSHDHDHHHHSHSHDDHSSEFGHSHGGHHHATPVNFVHRLLLSLLSASRLNPLIHWLEESAFSSIAKIVLFLTAAATAWASGSAAAAAQETLFRQISTAATAGVFFFAGMPAAVELILAVAALKIDTHVLMNLAVVGTLVTGFPLEGALLLVLFQTSHAVEHLLTAKAQGNLQALYNTIPDHAEIVRMGADGVPIMATAQRIPAESVGIGEVMLVKAGCQVPLDGQVVYGRALVSAEHITGESLPALKRQGDELPAGSICHDGVLAVRATRVADDSTPARIARLARDAQAQRPKLRTWLDRFGEMYSKAVIVMTVVALGAMVASGVPFLGHGGGAERGALYRAMGLLTVASPCALVMVPLAYVSAIAAVASRGILLKGGRVLDALDRCRVIAVDKTGTLTTGRLVVRDIQRISSNDSGGVGGGGGELNEPVVLGIAAALSLRSSHPVSNAIVERGARDGVDPDSIEVEDFSLVAGGGVSAIVSLSHSPFDGERRRYRACFGSVDFVRSEMSSTQIESLQKRGGAAAQGSSTVSVLVLSSPSTTITTTRTTTSTSSSEAVWVFSLEDSLRSASAAAVESLQRGTWTRSSSSSSKTSSKTSSSSAYSACEVIMLTGDNKSSAARVAGQLGITRVLSGLSPEDKLQQIAVLRTVAGGGGAGVVMVGDGLNDAAALAAADVGIAIASNTTAAATLAADVVVISQTAGMAAVPLLMRVARATKFVVAQNLALAAGSILVLAAPTVLGFMPLWLAVMLHEGSTLLVALNSLRLLRFSAVGQHQKQNSSASNGQLENDAEVKNSKKAEYGGGGGGEKQAAAEMLA